MKGQCGRRFTFKQLLNASWDSLSILSISISSLQLDDCGVKDKTCKIFAKAKFYNLKFIVLGKGSLIKDDNEIGSAGTLHASEGKQDRRGGSKEPDSI